MALRKLPRRFGAFVSPLLLSLLMTCIVSAISVLKAENFNLAALGSWPTAWMLSWVVAFPVLLLMMPLVRRITGLLVEA